MAWSKSKKKVQEPVIVPPANNPTVKNSENKHTVIGDGFKVEGVLRGNQDLILSGTLEGKLICSSNIVITPTGKVHGEIQCGSVQVQGTVEGNIEAKSEIVIHATGKVKGDITTPKLTHHPGGLFEGYSRMLPDSRASHGQAKSTGDKPVSGKKEK